MRTSRRSTLNPIFSLFACLLVLGLSSHVNAEGTYQTGANQDLFVDDDTGRADTILKVYIKERGEVINISAGNDDGNDISVTITNPMGVVVVDDVELTTGDGLVDSEDSLPECPLTTNSFQYVTGDTGSDTADNPGTFSTIEGQYTIEFDVDGSGAEGGTLDPFDITVTAETDDAVFPCAEDADGDGFIDANPTQEYMGGRLHSDLWSFNGNGYDNTTDADFFVLVPGGRDGENYTWMLDLTGVGGNWYEIAGNTNGVNSPNAADVVVAGFSVPMSGNTYDPAFELYLNHPAEAYPPGEPPVVSNFRFLDDDDEDNSISPNSDGVQDTGFFTFTSDVTGTYAIFIDGDDDGIYDPTTDDDILLAGPAVVGENSVAFDGNDNTGSAMAPGIHLAKISLRAGEYHFVGTDIEYCSPGIRILDANDPLNILPATMFWNDTLLSDTTTFDPSETYPDGLSSGALSDTPTVGVNTHSWGTQESSSEGSDVYVDTYVYGKTDTEPLEVVVTDGTNGNISSSTMTVSFDGTGTPRPGDTLEYTISLINTSTNAAVTDVSLTNAIPPGTTYVPGSLTTDSAAGYTLDATAATMATDLTVPEATDGDTPGTTTVTFEVTIDPGLGRTITTQSTFGYDSGALTGLTDSNPATPESETTDISIANDAPVADDDTFGITTIQTYELDVLDGDADADSGGLNTSSVVVSSATNGTVVFNDTTGLVEYTPNGPTAQDDSFTYTVLDNEGGISNTATVTIVVDSDGDGLSDDAEVNVHNTDPADADSDDDGLSDGDEVNTHTTDPNDADSDDDGLTDSEEVTGTTLTDPNDADSDDDGLSDGDEVNTHTTDPNDADSDDDGLTDSEEVTGATITDPNDADSDDDGLSDGDEVNTYNTDPNDADTDDGGVDDGTEVMTHGTDPLDRTDDIVGADSDTGTDSATDFDTGTDTGTESDTEFDTDSNDDSDTTSDTGSDTGIDSDSGTDSDTTPVSTTDRDSDGIEDDDDNCPDDPNRQQQDLDNDGLGDVCDNDRDGDGIINENDNCASVANPNQEDLDGNDMGDICQEEEFHYSGSTACSCSTVGSGPIDSKPIRGVLIMAFALLGILFRRKLSILFHRKSISSLVGFLMVLSIGLFTTTAYGQDATVNSQAFTPSPFMNDLYNVQKANTLRDNEYRWNAGVYFNYQNDPLVLRASDDSVVRKVVEHQVSADLLLAISLTKWLDVGLAAPLHIYQDGEGFAGGDAPSTFSVGDVRLHIKARLLQSKNDVASLAFVPVVTFPTGQLIDSFSGSAGVTFIPQLAWDMSWKRAGFALNAGYKFVKDEQVSNLTLSDELLFRFGTWVSFVPKKFSAIAEVSTTTRAKSPFAEIEETPIEALGGFRFYPADFIHLNLGGGMGVTQGYASPDFRVLAGVVFTSKKEPPPPLPPVVEKPKDSDGDGLLDEEDECPLKPEDKDKFEDEDGCPDPDNDQDGILDVKDVCPIDPEDFDDFEDEDGCAEFDNDMDGLFDTDDKCPNDPEDKDNFEDEDGCPDLDNDNDQILDENDKCPLEPETINGKEDEDGCPDSKAKVEGKKIIILDKIYFHYNKTKIMKKSFAVLDDVVDVMKNYSQIQLIEVEGHTDTRGKARYNKKLSAGRAKAVRKYLIDHGIEKERVQSVGKGEAEPLVSPEQTDEDYESNRRVEFEILKMEQAENVEIRNAE